MIGAVAAKRGHLDAGISAGSTLVIVGLRTNPLVKETAFYSGPSQSAVATHAFAVIWEIRRRQRPQMFNTSSKFNTYP